MERAALRDLKLLVWIGSLDFDKRHGFPLTSMSNKSPFRSASHFVNMGSWKAGNTSNPRKLKTQFRQFFIASVVFVAWKQQSALEIFGDHKPRNRIQTSLWQAWVAWIERGQQILGTENLRRKIIRIHHWFTTQTSTMMMFELDCDSWLNNSPLPTLWSLHELNVFAVALVLNKPCLWGLCIQSSMVKHGQTHCAHAFGSFLWYSARFSDMLNSGLLRLLPEWKEINFTLCPVDF